MMMRRPVPLLPLILALGAAAAPARAQSAFPSDSAIRAIMEARVGPGGSAGIVIGLLEPDGRTRVLAAGSAGAGRTLDAQSVFEIGSITKVFTGVLLADMVRRGEVMLGDPVSKYLPASVRVPARNGIAITLEHLAVQNSGLPRLPNNMRPASMANPYADYSVEQLYAFLDGYTLARDPGEAPEYSNVAVGLLGHVLARRAGTTYEALLRERVLDPLGMASTRITLTPEQRARFAAGHNALGDTVPPWDMPTLPGMGALRSNVTDLLRFAEAALRGRGGAAEAIRFAMQRRAPMGAMGIGLLWVRRPVAGDTIVWHNGGTGGFRTFIGVAPGSGKAVVLLTNTGNSGLDDVAFHLLDPTLPLRPPPAPPPAAAQQAASRRTFVIVHGAWGGSWDWRTVDSLLTAQGHRVFRPDLTGLGKRHHLASAAIGLDTHITDVVNEILWEELDDVVLVGHSYGGMVITGVADRIGDRIRELVYLDAFLPESGESVAALRPSLSTANARDGLLVPSWEPADKPVPKDVPHPLKTFTDTLRLAGTGPKVPARYILTSEPSQQPDAFQFFADRAAARGWKVITMQAGHVPERTQPAELVALLLGQ